MKCSKCGYEITDGSKFCPECGSKLNIVFSSELIEAATNNDQQAISELYNETYNSVYQTIKAIIKSDEDTVLDLVQDTYIRGFKYLAQLDKPENFRAWIKRIGANTAKNYLVKKKPLLFSQLQNDEDNEEPEEYLIRDNNPENMPEVVVDRKETERLLTEILDSLSDDQRLALTMFYFNEMSVKEIAEELGCSENTVKSRLNYGRKKVEVKVRELEKKGTKLYGLAPFAFVLLLFRARETEAAVMPDEQILNSVLSSRAAETISTSAKVDASAKAAASTKIAASGAGAVAKGVVIKIIAGVAAVAVLATAGVVTFNVIKNNSDKKEVAIEETEIEYIEESDEVTDFEEVTEESTKVLNRSEHDPVELLNGGNDPYTLTFEELRAELENASHMSAEAYEASREYYDERYWYLGYGTLDYIIYKEVDIYSVLFCYREYDIDDDGEDEMLFGWFVSPSRINPIAIYNLGEDPITGDDINEYDFPYDAYDEMDAWIGIIN